MWPPNRHPPSHFPIPQPLRRAIEEEEARWLNALKSGVNFPASLLSLLYLRAEADRLLLPPLVPLDLN